ncbi:cysteine desulfurase family protein [Sporosarcina pasteurii]|uniref:cysteine desulfurase n=1 Tax=Sporosarcina pasteurii TaxID=1474 RepID=A0A380BMH2_SPOPA|nr:cysteine desulfurase family protein [Sporosarcina pasteurii]MDS9470979.1 cysteine desulfurase family protein [Sporosarcina pasteurii]QBQ05370.1 cysteine desulfurase [Sporosarcina pasteurii]SUJ03571.1 Cysteine desulfurase [Sporosarcina pasteurii]
MKAIYLDHAATTPVHPLVTEKYAELLNSVYGNPSSIHQYGREARKWLADARKVMAQSIHAKPTEIIFTSGGTEADNMAIFGAVNAMKSKGNHIITTNIEHHAVLNTCKQLQIDGFDVTILEADINGQVHVEQVAEALRDETILVTIMLGNNEVGTIQPIDEIGKLLTSHQALFHTDAVQAYGIVPINVDTLGVDLLSVSSHKLNGPKGVGFLYERTGTPSAPLVYGGEQERKRRAGTENVPAIVAFSEAVKIAEQTSEENSLKYHAFEKKLTTILAEQAIQFTVNAVESDRLPHITNISFPGTDIESLLVNLDMAGVCVSSGSACTAGSLDPSHVLTAMYGKGATELRNSVRFSYGYGLTIEQIEKVAYKTAEIVARLVK